MYSLDSSDRNTVVLDKVSGFAQAIVANASNVLFKGVGHQFNEENPLVFPVLNANPSSISWDMSAKGSPSSHPNSVYAVGSEISLVSVSQTRNNARILLVGSMELLSDKLFSVKNSGNKHFVDELFKWVLQEKSVLRVGSVKHHRKGETFEREWYRIKDDFVFEVQLEAYSGETGQWKPFQIPDGDILQFEAVMLDPYLRLNMAYDKSTQSYMTPAQTILPDQHGVFTFKAEYKRRGYTFIEAKVVRAVQPFRHNEYPRFLSQAFPYYANMLNMMFSAVLLAGVFLLFKDPQQTKQKTK